MAIPGMSGGPTGLPGYRVSAPTPNHNSNTIIARSITSLSIKSATVSSCTGMGILDDYTVIHN